MKVRQLNYPGVSYIVIEHSAGSLTQQVTDKPVPSLVKEAIRLDQVAQRLSRRAVLLREAAQLLEVAS